MIKLDPLRCIGCGACEVQCQVKTRTPPAVRPALVLTAWPPAEDPVPRMTAAFRPCFHCETPWCVAACPTGAMQKRAADGIVFIDPGICVGCKACITACPWGAPQWNPETGKAVKCDYCKDRVDAGLKPACVTVCITHCLSFGPAEETVQFKRERHAQSVAKLG